MENIKEKGNKKGERQEQIRRSMTPFPPLTPTGHMWSQTDPLFGLAPLLYVLFQGDVTNGLRSLHSVPGPSTEREALDVALAPKQTKKEKSAALEGRERRERRAQASVRERERGKSKAKKWEEEGGKGKTDAKLRNEKTRNLEIRLSLGWSSIRGRDVLRTCMPGGEIIVDDVVYRVMGN